MAKKSAKSKGFRKTVSKKPYLSKKEIIILCVIVAIIAVVAIVLSTYDDGSVRLANIAEGDLVVEAGASGQQTRYYPVASVGEPEGYTRTRGVNYANLAVPSYVLAPAEGAEAEIDSIHVDAYHHAAADMAQTYMSGMSAETSVAYTLSELTEGDLGGVHCQYFTYTMERPQEEEAQAADSEAAEETTPAEDADAEATDADSTDATAAEPEATADADAEANDADSAEAPADTEVSAADSAEAAADDAEAPADVAEGEADADDGETADAAKALSRYEQGALVFIDASHDSCINLRLFRNAETEEELLSDEALLDYFAQVLPSITIK